MPLFAPPQLPAYPPVAKSRLPKHNILCPNRFLKLYLVYRMEHGKSRELTQKYCCFPEKSELKTAGSASHFSKRPAAYAAGRILSVRSKERFTKFRLAEGRKILRRNVEHRNGARLPFAVQAVHRPRVSDQHARRKFGIGIEFERKFHEEFIPRRRLARTQHEPAVRDAPCFSFSSSSEMKCTVVS